MLCRFFLSWLVFAAAVLLTLPNFKSKEVGSVQMQGTICTTTQLEISEHFNLQQNRFENLKFRMKSSDK